jgi:hypothetical protein
LEPAANSIPALKYPGRRDPDGLLGECCGHGVHVPAIVRRRKVPLEIGYGAVSGSTLLGAGVGWEDNLQAEDGQDCFRRHESFRCAGPPF